MIRTKLLSITSVCLIGCASASETEISATWAPLSPVELYAGRDLPAWAVEWGRWVYARTGCELPEQDADGSWCDYDQPEEEPVFFFAAGQPLAVRTKCKVPPGRAIVVPLVAFITDNAGVEPDEHRSDATLRTNAERFSAGVTDLRLVVDGAEQDGSELHAHLIEPTQFSYELPAEPNRYSCRGKPGVTGQVAPAFIAGAFAVLPPPASSQLHTLEYAGLARVDDRVRASHVKATFEVE